jgi:AcrR family transcriptional regulator
VKLLDGSLRASVDETRSRILAATRELFALKGTRGTTTREVADLAGVNEATVFRHFRTKQALLHEMLDQYCESRDQMPDLVALLNGPGPIEQQLSAMGHLAIEGIKRKEDLIRVGLAEQVIDPDASAMTWRAPVAALSLLSEFMQKHIDAGELHGDAGMLARMFLSFWFTYVLGRKIWNTPDDAAERDRVVKLCVETFLNGACSR